MLNEQASREVARFFGLIASSLRGYTHRGFSFFAVQDGPHLSLVQGRCFLYTTPSNIPAGMIVTPNLRVGHFRISNKNGTLERLVEQLAAGTLSTGYCDLRFPAEEGG